MRNLMPTIDEKGEFSVKSLVVLIEKTAKTFFECATEAPS
jgi:hypothetical protein